jgi:hypothetical protein
LTTMSGELARRSGARSIECWTGRSAECGAPCARSRLSSKIEHPQGVSGTEPLRASVSRVGSRRPGAQAAMPACTIAKVQQAHGVRASWTG